MRANNMYHVKTAHYDIKCNYSGKNNVALYQLNFHEDQTSPEIPLLSARPWEPAGVGEWMENNLRNESQKHIEKHFFCKKFPPE